MIFLTEEPMSVVEQFISHWNEWWTSIQHNLGNYIFDLVKIIIILVVCKILLAVISAYTKKVMNRNNEKKIDNKVKRSNTILTLVRSVSRYMVYFVGALMIVDILGYGNVLSGLVLTAGVGSLAVGFGAQSLVKDVVTGFFLMFENQFSVGDYIKVNNAEGTVEAIAMRVTYLRTREGSQIIVPNGQISVVENITRGNSMARIVISTRYEDDTNNIIEIIKEVVANYAKEKKKLLLGEPNVLAITSFSSSSVDITVTCRTKNLMHWQVERDLRLAIKNEFDHQGIVIPHQMIVITQQEDKESFVKKKGKSTKK